jgi:hypothetical protein
MDINIPTLLQYVKKNGYSATVSVSIDTPDPCLIFILGENREGSRREYVDFKNINEILILNNIIGRTTEDPSLVKDQLDLLSSTAQDRSKRPENIENLIYGTLAKYMIQILHGANGELYYPEIKPLQHHKQHFAMR